MTEGGTMVNIHTSHRHPFHCWACLSQPRLFPLWLSLFLTFPARTNGAHSQHSREHKTDGKPRIHRFGQKTLEWSTIISLFVRIDGFDNPALLVSSAFSPLSDTFSSLLITLMQNPDPGQGTLRLVARCEKAAHNTEGSLRAVVDTS